MPSDRPHESQQVPHSRSGDDGGSADDWSAYGEPDRWPASPGRVSFLRLNADLTEAILDISADDIAAAEGSGECRRGDDPRGAAVGTGEFLVGLARDGCLTTFARRVGGERSQQLSPLDWDVDDLGSVIRTGALHLREEEERVAHHVFVDAAEANLLLELYEDEHADDIELRLRLRHDRLFEIILDQLPSIARARTTDGKAERLFRLLAPDAPPSLDERGRERLLDAAGAWLADRLHEDKEHRRRRPSFCAEAMRRHYPLLSKRQFDRVWDRVTSRPEHARRREGGRRPEAPKPDAGGKPAR